MCFPEISKTYIVDCRFRNFYCGCSDIRHCRLLWLLMVITLISFRQTKARRNARSDPPPPALAGGHGVLDQFPVLVQFWSPFQGLSLLPAQICFCTPPKSSAAARAFRQAAPKYKFVVAQKSSYVLGRCCGDVCPLLPPKNGPRMTQMLPNDGKTHAEKMHRKHETVSRCSSRFYLLES